MTKLTSKTLATLLLVALSVTSLTSCGGNSATGSADLEIDLGGTGIMSPVANKTCVDAQLGSGSTTRSAAVNSMVFPALRLRWKNTKKSLYIALMRVTVTGSRITQTAPIVITNDEIEALLGLPGLSINPTDTTFTKTTDGAIEFVSNKTTNRGGFIACGFTIGGIGATASTGTNVAPFEVTVTVEVVGQATGSEPSDSNPNGNAGDGTNIEVIRKTFTTSATAYL